MTTPLFIPPPATHPSSALSLSTAWKAPRTLNAPTRCRFSHLNHSRMTGRAFFSSCFSSPSPPPASPPPRASRSPGLSPAGVDASRDSVELVSTGVRWTCGRTRLCAAITEARVKGGQVLRSAIVRLLVVVVVVSRGVVINHCCLCCRAP